MEKVKKMLWKSEFEKLIVVMLTFFGQECGEKM